MELYNKEIIEPSVNYDLDFIQCNISRSNYGVIRGLHFQNFPHAQAKFISVISGKILDVVVDLRPNSKTYGKVFTVEISVNDNTSIFIPRGFAHGFSVLADNTSIIYSVDNYYCKESESGIIYNDQILNIDWKIDYEKIIISKKIRNYQLLMKSKKIIFWLLELMVN